MSDFIFWNLVFGIVYVLWRITMWLMPKGTTFVVRSVSNSKVHGWIGSVLIDDQIVMVSRTGSLWRYTKSGKMLPEEWQDQLEERTT